MAPTMRPLHPFSKRAAGDERHKRDKQVDWVAGDKEVAGDKDVAGDNQVG